MVDELSLAGPLQHPGIAVRAIAEPTVFRAYAALNADQPVSIFAEAMVDLLKAEMNDVATSRNPV